jgi:hypothetical protein
LQIPPLNPNQEKELTASGTLNVGFKTTSILQDYSTFVLTFAISGKDLNEKNNKHQLAVTVCA